MFSNPSVSEWIAGTLSAVLAAGLIVGLSALISYVVIRIWGDEDETGAMLPR
jgi:hypothetical protein